MKKGSAVSHMTKVPQVTTYQAIINPCVTSRKYFPRRGNQSFKLIDMTVRLKKNANNRRKIVGVNMKIGTTATPKKLVPVLL